MDELKQAVIDFIDKSFVVALICAAAVVLLMLVFFIAMLVNYGKRKGSKTAKSGSSGNGGASGVAKLQAECEELKKEGVSNAYKQKVLQDRLTETERKLKACEEQIRFDEENFEKMEKRADEAGKEVERLQKENEKLKEQAAKKLTLESVIDKSVFDEEQPVKKQAAKPKTERTKPAEKAASAEKSKPVEKKTDSAKDTAKVSATSDAAKDSETTGTYEVVYDKEQENWVVRKRGGLRATRRFRTKEEAVQYSKEVATNQNASLSIHKKDGKFQKL